jgi:two-component system, OmpR family, response regulator
MKRFDLLIIDDERGFADILAKRMEIRGCSCCVRYTGREGIDMLERSRFALVVLDLRLPDMYGTEVLREIKTKSPDTPVIILTAHGSEEDRVECMESCAFGFFNKPLEIDRLLTILEAARGKVA